MKGDLSKQISMLLLVMSACVVQALPILYIEQILKKTTLECS